MEAISNKLSHLYAGFRLCSSCVMRLYIPPGSTHFCDVDFNVSFCAEIYALFSIHCFLLPNALCYGIFNFPRLLSKPPLLFLRSWKNSVWLINNENFRNCYMTLLSISSPPFKPSTMLPALCFFSLFPFALIVLCYINSTINHNAAYVRPRICSAWGLYNVY